MKTPLTRRPATPSPHPVETAQEKWDIGEQTGEDVGGWSTGARANTSTLLRWTAWGLLVLGPLIGTAAFARASATTAPKAVATASTPSGTGSQGAAGFATLFVAEFLRSGEGDQDKLAAYYPAASDLQLEGESGRRHGEQLTVVRLRQTDPEVWSVTVAARIVSDTAPAVQKSAATDGATAPSSSAAAVAVDTVHYFQVPVAVGPAAGGASGYVALSMPAEVAAPARIKTPDLIYGPVQPATSSDPRAQAVTQFLDAYLTGSGELDRYLAPGTTLTAIQPAPYTVLSVDALAIEGDQGSEPVTTVPADGTRTRLVVTLRATDRDKVRVPLAYALTLKSRAGRWEIAALDGAPSPNLAAQPAASSPAATPTP